MPPTGLLVQFIMRMGRAESADQDLIHCDVKSTRVLFFVCGLSSLYSDWCSQKGTGFG